MTATPSTVTLDLTLQPRGLNLPPRHVGTLQLDITTRDDGSMDTDAVADTLADRLNRISTPPLRLPHAATGAEERQVIDLRRAGPAFTLRHVGWLGYSGQVYALRDDEGLHTEAGFTPLWIEIGG